MDKNEAKRIIDDEINNFYLENIRKSLSKPHVYLASTLASLEEIRRSLGKLKEYFTDNKIIDETMGLCKEFESELSSGSEENVCEYCNDARLREHQVKRLKETVTLISRNIEKIAG